MHTKVLEQTNVDHLKEAAAHILGGEAIIVYFNGIYAFLGDADQLNPANQIFEIKNRPRSKTLSLVCAPPFLQEFIDLSQPALKPLTLSVVTKLYHTVHAVGLVFPANMGAAPKQLILNGTILNVWTEHAQPNPIFELQELCRQRGMRAFLGASANLSYEPTYISLSQVKKRFNNKVSLILNRLERSPVSQNKSTSIVDLTGDAPLLIREGSLLETELRTVLAAHNLGELGVSNQVKRL